MPLTLSIITCTWNSASYLPASIASVLAQDYPHIEYIFVDGGSTDGTLEQIAALPVKAKVLHNVRGGISHAMNEGIRVATGDVIAHIHSDDYYLGTDVFSKVLAVFEKTGCQWLFGRIMSDIDGVLTPESYTVPQYSFKRFLRRNFIPHPATFIRLKVFDEVGVFSETLRYAMDYDQFLRIGKRYEPHQLDSHLAAFRRHDGSTTQKNFMKSFAEDFLVRCTYSNWYQLPEATLRYLIRRQRHMQRLVANE
jgi:glycosyltransferase involved in cell wall biosynthesis